MYLIKIVDSFFPHPGTLFDAQIISIPSCLTFDKQELEIDFTNIYAEDAADHSVYSCSQLEAKNIPGRRSSGPFLRAV